MWVGLLTDRINNKLEESNLINKHAFNREPVPVILTVYCPGVLAMYIVNCGTSTPSSDELAPRNFEKKKLQNYQWNMELLICSWLYGGHIGWQEQRGVSPHRELFFFLHLLPKRKKKPYFFVNQHGKPRIQKKSESAGVLLRELKKNAIITIDLNIWTATHTNSYLITENLNRQETASSLTLFSPCSLSFFLSCLDSFKEIVQFIIQQHNGLFPVLRDMYIWTCK